jgi:hypothetical protein
MACGFNLERCRGYRLQPPCHDGQMTGIDKRPRKEAFFIFMVGEAGKVFGQLDRIRSVTLKAWRVWERALSFGAGAFR